MIISGKAMIRIADFGLGFVPIETMVAVNSTAIMTTTSVGFMDPLQRRHSEIRSQSQPLSIGSGGTIPCTRADFALR